MANRTNPTIASGETVATFAARGAEMISLRHGDREYLWHADPAWWGFNAPILFPVVGRSPQDRIKVGGVPYPMPLHGFALSRNFEIVEHDSARIVFRLTDDAETRAMFPFPFRLTIVATIATQRIDFSTTIENTGSETAPFAFGYHPALMWAPTPQERASFICKFDAIETGEIRRVNRANGLLRAERFSLKFDGRVLAVSDALFEQGSLQFEANRSRRIWFGRPGHKGIDVRFPDSPQLGLWTRAGAPFLCIEPWQGMADTEASDGELSRRPGARLVAAGERIDYRLSIDLNADEIP